MPTTWGTHDMSKNYPHEPIIKLPHHETQCDTTTFNLQTTPTCIIKQSGMHNEGRHHKPQCHNSMQIIKPHHNMPNFTNIAPRDIWPWLAGNSCSSDRLHDHNLHHMSRTFCKQWLKSASLSPPRTSYEQCSLPTMLKIDASIATNALHSAN